MKHSALIIFIFLIVSTIECAPLNNSKECPEEKLEMIGECVTDLVATVEKITKWVDQEYKFNRGEKDDFKKKCKETQKCFNTVKSSCPDFPEDVTRELDVMCSRFNFIIDKFTDCVPKLDNLNEVECVNELFGPKSLKKTSNEKCLSIKEHRSCARREVENACGPKMSKVLDKNFDEELEMYKCQ